jgi:uncharacterized protein (DUF983 family)
MTLMKNGYWNEKYFVENYWSNNYWQDYALTIPRFLLLSLTQGFPLKVALTQEVL